MAMPLFLGDTNTARAAVYVDAPVSNGIDDFSVFEDASPTVLNLFDVFDDEDDDQDLALSVIGNTNPGLVSTSAVDDNGLLTLTYFANQTGSATITVQATDTEGLSTEEAFTVTILEVNDAPSFNVGFSPSVDQNSGAQTFQNWATAISAGPNESGQSVEFQVSPVNPSLFSAGPSVSPDGTLTFTPAENVSGISTVILSLLDDGGTSNGGINESPNQSFTITVSNNNSPPTTTGIGNVNVLEDAVNTSINLYDVFDDAEDADQDLTYAVTLNTDPALFSSTAINAGTLALDYAPDANGSSILTVQATDTGGLSVSATFTVVVTPVNDEPTFSKGADLTASDDDPLTTIPSWATNISEGASNESFQNLSFSVTTPNTSLFSVQPSLNNQGTLTFQPALNTSGVATLTVTLFDDGGTANGGDNTSASQTFTITISNSNSPPTTSGIGNQTVNEDSQPVSISLFNAFDDAEDADAALTYNVDAVSNPGIFVGGAPTIIPSTGTLLLTFVSDASGSSTVTVRATDTGGLFETTQFTVTVTPVNDAPSFTPGPDLTVPEDAPPQNQGNWATNISAGPSDEASQTISFSLTASNTALFSVQPSLSNSGTLTFTPAPDAFGSTQVTATIMDSGGTDNGGINTGAPITFTITLTPSNDPPVVMADDYRLLEGESLIASAGGNPPGVLDNDDDVDGDVLVATVINEPNFAQTWSFNSNGSFFYLHDGSENLIDTFTYQVTDGTVTSQVVTATITIIPENDPPVPGEIQDVRVNEDSPDLPVPLFDAFEDPDDPDTDLSFAVTSVSNPGIFDDLDNSAINQQTGILTLDFLNNTNGLSTVTVQAMDPVGSSAQITFDVEIVPVNDPPTMDFMATIDLEEDPGPQSIPNWATNISVGPPDEANQQLSATITANSNPDLFSTQPAFIINGSNGTLTFTPAPQAGGIAELTITLTDTGGLTNGGDNTTIYTFAIIIRGDNDRPISEEIDAVSIPEDGSVPTFNLFTIFDDIEDPDSLLTYTIESEINDTLFKNVQLGGNPALLEIELENDAYGSTTVTVRATDTGGLWAEEDILIDILPVNDAPSFTRGEDITIAQNSPGQSVENWATNIQVGPENEQSQVPSFVILSNDNEPLFITQPAVSSDGTLTFEPSLSGDAFGTANVVIALVDNGGTANGGIDQSVPDTLVITLQRFNTPPTANNDNYIVDQGQSIQFDVSLGLLSNDTDLEGDPLSARVVAPPVNGTLTLNPDGSFTYQHDNSRTTNDAFTYVANDGFEDSDVASVTISVQPLNTLFLREVTVAEDSDSTLIDMKRQILFPEEDQFEFEIGSISNPGLFSRVAVDTLTGVITLVYAPNQFGFSSINVNASSTNGTLINATQNVNILPVNDAPIAVDDIAATIENNPVEINVLNNDVDFDNDDLTIRTFSQPTNGDITPRSNGSFLYRPPTDFTGEVTFSYVVGDDSLANDEGLVRITIFAGRFGVSQLAIQESDISAAYSVSNAGEVVGVKRTPEGIIKAFSSEQELSSDTPSEASAANDFGQVVGALGIPQGDNPEIVTLIASRWDTSGVTALGAFDDRTSKAFSINNEGLIVGTSTWDNSDLLRGFIWEGGQLIALETNSGNESQAFGINERGQIAGYEGASAVLWNGEIILRRLVGSAGRAYDVNENQQSVGSIDDGTVKAVFWDVTGNPVILHPDESTFSEAYGINSSTWVVGTYLPNSAGKQADSNTQKNLRKAASQHLLNAADKETTLHSAGNTALRAFLWQGDQLVNLNDLIDPASGWVLLEARSINNAAQITGIGLFNGEQKAFLLSPTNSKAPIVQDPDPDPSTIPVENYLSQNYPNPFNPTTTIAFGLAEPSHVRLELFNVLGQRIDTLIDEERAAGSYTLQFDAKGLPGGVYIYRIQTDRFSDTRQFILLK